jgi:hypothetical protein
MPSTSKKQHNFMEAVAHSPSFAKKAGVPQSVGKEFSNADKGKKFSTGGQMATTKMGKPTMKPGMSTAKDGMKKPTPMANTMMAPATPMGMKKGGMPMKMKDGKKVPIFAAKGGGIESKGKTKGKMITMKKGGRAC